MEVKTLKDCQNTERDVKFKEGTSLRFVLKKDNMGFSVHKTTILKGNIGKWHYKNHLESCYCIKGKGLLTNEDTKEVFIIEVDTVYSLNNNDKHTFEALEDVVLISIFNPPLNGNEIHLKDGSYKKNNYIKTLSKKIVKQVYSCNSYYDANDIVEELLIKKN